MAADRTRLDEDGTTQKELTALHTMTTVSIHSPHDSLHLKSYASESLIALFRNRSARQQQSAVVMLSAPSCSKLAAHESSGSGTTHGLAEELGETFTAVKTAYLINTKKYLGAIFSFILGIELVI